MLYVKACFLTTDYGSWGIKLDNASFFKLNNVKAYNFAYTWNIDSTSIYKLQKTKRSQYTSTFLSCLGQKWPIYKSKSSCLFIIIVIFYIWWPDDILHDALQHIKLIMKTLI